MSSVAGYKTKVYAKSTSASAVSGDEIAGLNDATYEEIADLLETTTFKSGSASAWKTRLASLGDGTIDIAGDYESADAPQILLRTSKRSGADVYITILVDPAASAGSQGFRVPCKVSKFSAKDSVGGKTEFSCSLSFNGAPTDV